MQRAARRGFTLIELLVVIAIIAILAAILFPVFAQAREKARTATCQSNLKQLGTALMMYTQDYDEMFPLYDHGGGWYGFVYTTPPDSRPGNVALRSGNWAVTCQPYIKNWGVFNCPSCPLATQFGSAVPTGKPVVPIAYEMNGLLTNGSQAAIQKVADVIMVWEAYGKASLRNYAGADPQVGYSGKTSGPHQSFPPNDANPNCDMFIICKDATCASNRTPSYWVHSEGSNYLFCDGHVKWRRLSTDYRYSPWAGFDPATGEIRLDQDQLWADGTYPNGTGCPWLFRPNLQ